MKNIYKYIQVKSKDLLEIKKQLLQKQKYICPICGVDMKDFESKGIHVDHQHFGDKLIRAALCRRCNNLEGKLYNAYMRYTKNEDKSTEDYLRVLKGLARYPKLKPTKYIHPSGIKKRIKTKKKSKKT